MGTPVILSLLLVAMSCFTAASFTPPSSSSSTAHKMMAFAPTFISKHNTHDGNSPKRQLTTSLHMSDSGDGGGGSGAREKSKKKGLTTITIDRTELASKQEEKKEEQWRVVLHNDEVHTFNYVIQSLCKVIGTVDRKRAFDICVLTHGSGKATITQTWKDQAMKYCFGLQRQGLTASIAPESRFSGGGGGDGGGDGGGGDGPDAGKS